MQILRRFWLICLASLALLGCSQSELQPVTETEEKQYQRGLRLLREGRKDEALFSFIKVTEVRDNAPESHLEIGQLYGEHFNDPIAAIYHYRKYLEYDSDSAQAMRVQQLIDTAKKDFARQLPGRPFKNDIDRLDLLELLEETRDENISLEKQLATAQSRINRLEQVNIGTMQSVRAAQQTTAKQAPKPTANATSYTVVAGDTLSRISTKVYGKPGQWKHIYEANRDTMSSPHSLKAGQTLRIP